MLGGLDGPTSGKIIVDGRDISELSGDELAKYRAEKVGFVLQFYNLIPKATPKRPASLISRIRYIQTPKRLI